MAAELTAEQRSQAALAVIRGLVRLGQLVEAVEPLDKLLDGHPLAAQGKLLGDALVTAHASLTRQADELAPAVAAADPTLAAPPEKE